MDWSTLYPDHIKPADDDSNLVNGSIQKPSHPKMIEFADVGCGYGGLLGIVSRQCRKFHVALDKSLLFVFFIKFPCRRCFRIV